MHRGYTKYLKEWNSTIAMPWMVAAGMMLDAAAIIGFLGQLWYCAIKGQAVPIYSTAILSVCTLTFIVASCVGFVSACQKRDKAHQEGVLALKQKHEADILRLENDSRDLLKLRGVHRENPQERLQVLVKRVALFHSAKEASHYIDVELYIQNGNVFDLDYGLTLKETELTVDHTSYGNLKNVPTIQNQGADRLGAGSLSNVTTIRQVLSGNIASMVFEPTKPRYIEWKFNVLLSITLEGRKRDRAFSPYWDGMHDRMFEV